MKTTLLAFALTVALGASAASFTEQDFIVVNPNDGTELHGTLTLPDGDTHPRAAVLLISGSGPQDRDEEILGHRPFKAIAEFLGDRGYAVARLDDRGVGQSGGDHEAATLADFTADATAALATLRQKCPDTPCGVLGHSMGGSIAMKLGASNPDCAFIITLAAPAWEGDSIVMSQSRLIAESLTGEWKNENLQRKLMDVAKSALPSSLARPMLASILGEAYGDAVKLPAVAENISKQADGLLTPWYREMLRYNPHKDMMGVRCPWLAMNGSLDTQVVPANLTTISQANPAATTKLMDGHNHLFQHATSGFPAEYAQIQEDISQETLEYLAQWLDSLGSIH